MCEPSLQRARLSAARACGVASVGLGARTRRGGAARVACGLARVTPPPRHAVAATPPNVRQGAAGSGQGGREARAQGEAREGIAGGRG
eukprot:3381451-Prymnesium_polylepis.1